MNYSYPGNVRELENILERAFVLGGEVLLPDYLPDSVRSSRQFMPGTPIKTETDIVILDDIELPVNLDEILEKVECRYLTAALKKTNGAKKKAAESSYY